MLTAGECMKSLHTISAIAFHIVSMRQFPLRPFVSIFLAGIWRGTKPNAQQFSLALKGAVQPVCKQREGVTSRIGVIAAGGKEL